MSPAATLDAAGARAVALRTADHLFYERGVAGVTMAAIRDESGVSLRRLYSLFPSKPDLVAAWLDHRHGEWMAAFEASVAAKMGSGLDPVDAVFSALEAWMTETDFRGCGFINTHAEASELTEEHRDIIRRHKRVLAEYLEKLVPYGSMVALIVDGAIVQAAIFGTAEPIHIAHRAAAALTAGVSA